MNDLEHNPKRYEVFLPIIQKMVTGELDEQETEELLTIIDASDEHLETADALWTEHWSLLNGDAELEPARAEQLEQRLKERIERSDLSGQIVRMGTQGFAQVALAFLRPLLRPPQEDAGER
ncbi:MAG: hypothetical protein KDE51_05445 [Anaerolineales bacterium]|nr:hypothetical protein [Anaerolineales bacterium]